MTAIDRREIQRYDGSATVAVTDDLVVEAPVEIRIKGVPIAVLMRTPGDDDDLTRGFCLTEGIVLQPGEIAGIRLVGNDTTDARYELLLAEGIAIDPEQFRRNLYTSSSCGVCGKASIDAVRIAAPAPQPGPIFDATVLAGLPDGMRRAQTAFSRTGGLHAAAAFATDGSLIALREDIGRHNAVDKLVGALSGSRWPLEDVALVVSGRVSFEIVQKAAVAGIGLVGGISAASSLAVDLAIELGVSVAGFIRSGSFNIYAGGGRIRG